MRYFTIGFDTSQAYGDLKTPHDADGNYYPDRKGLVCEVEHVVAEWNTKARKPADCISCFEHEIVSRRATEVLRRFKCDGGISFVPLRIVDDREEFHDGFTCIFIPHFRKGLVDLDRSRYKTYSDGTPMLFEDPIVLVEELPPYDFFGAQYAGRVCSEPVKKAIEEEGLINFEFKPLER